MKNRKKKLPHWYTDYTPAELQKMYEDLLSNDKKLDRKK